MYEGEVINSVFEGKGKLMWKNGKVFVGDFKNGVPVEKKEE